MKGGYAPKRCKRDLRRVAFASLRRVIEQEQRALGEAHALFWAQVCECILRRLRVVAHRGARLAAALEVHCELRGGDRYASDTLPFERGADFAVKLCAGGCGRALVHHLPKESVPERIRRFRRVALMPGTRGDEPQLLACKLVARVHNPVGVPLECMRDCVHTELYAADRGRREQQALIVRELRDVMVDDCGKFLWYCDFGQLRGRSRVAVRLSTRDDFAHHGRHEQRQTVGALMQRTHERFVGGDRWRSLGHVVRDLTFRERVEHDLLAEAVQAQLVPQRAERMVQCHDLGDTKACQPHQPRAATPSRDIVDELERRAVAPMQVFGHEQQRSALGRAIENLAHLAQHAIRADPRELSSKRFALVRGAVPRQLQEPGRCDGAQQRHKSAVVSAQLRERFQHWQVRFPCTVMLHALAARDSNVAKRGDEVFDERRLADTRFAGDPDDRAFSAARHVPRAPKARKRFCATGERWQVRRGDFRSVRPCRCRGRDGNCGGNEPIASPRHRFDEARLASIVVERCSEITDHCLQDRFADELVTPNLIEQRLLGEQRPRLPRECA